MHVKWYMDTLELAELQKDLSISVRHATDTPLHYTELHGTGGASLFLAAQAAVHVRLSVSLALGIGVASFPRGLGTRLASVNLSSHYHCW